MKNRLLDIVALILLIIVFAFAYIVFYVNPKGDTIMKKEGELVPNDIISEEANYISNGYIFQRISGINYEDKEDGLIVKDESQAVRLYLTSGSYYNVDIDSLRLQVADTGLTSLHVPAKEKVGNREIITMKAKIEDKEVTYFVTKADSDNLFEGFVYNSNFIATTSDIHFVAKILDNVAKETYKGATNPKEKLGLRVFKLEK